MYSLSPLFQRLLSDLELSRLVFILYFLSLEASASSMDHATPSISSSPPHQTHPTLCLLCPQSPNSIAFHWEDVWWTQTCSSLLGLLCPAHSWYNAGEA